MEGREPSYIVSGNGSWYRHYGEYGSSLKKLKVELSYDPEVSLLGIYPEEKHWSERIHAPQYLLQHCLQ